MSLILALGRQGGGGSLGVRGQLGLHKEFQASWGYREILSQNNNKKVSEIKKIKDFLLKSRILTQYLII